VSIDSPDPAVYRDTRGGDLHRACEGARRLASALGPGKVTVSSVMMQITIESLAAFPPVLAGLGVKKYVLQGLIDYRRDMEAEEVGRHQGLAERIASIRRRCNQAGVELSLALPDRVATELSDGDERPLASCGAATGDGETKQCWAPWELPVIDKDGRVFPCCYGLSNATAVLGDLREESPEDVWFGAQYERFRGDILDSRTTPAVCRSCTVVRSGPHPLARYSAQILPGQPTVTAAGHVTLLVRNTGRVAWTARDQIHIGTSDPRDRPSGLFHPSWIGLNRIGSFTEPSVDPGGIATFHAEIARSGEGAAETFQLVVENQCWVPGSRFRISPPNLPADRPSPLRARAKEALRRLLRHADM
jgi:radical SAM protein with 4Fe4S-binding SPASM domain